MLKKILEPNWRDERTYVCVGYALAWAVCHLRVDQDRFVGVRELERQIGKIYQNRAPQWLYHNLLVQTSVYYSHDLQRARPHRINPVVAQFLKDYLDIYSETEGQIRMGFPRDFSFQMWQAEQPEGGVDDTLAGRITVENSLDEYIDLLTESTGIQDQLQSGHIEYEDKSQRLWNPLQHFRRDIKRQVLTRHQYRYHYDIVAAAPTLLLARARQHDPTVSVPAIEALVQDPGPLRDHIRSLVPGADDTRAKRIINAMLSGALISTHPTSSILAMCYHSTTAIRALQASEQIQEFRQQVRALWTVLDPEMGAREIRTNRRGHQYRVRRSSRDKWAVYFGLERQVLDQVRAVFRRHQARVFLEHDGWSSTELIDTQEIQRHISRKLGFDVKIKWERS